ncbi:MAG: response regulator [Calditrichae bacterium]|nr:response regulator [Calditrichia bacterium]
MNQVFVRSEQLADKIHDIKLYIPEWKVLFSLDGRKNEDNIAGFLETDLQEVQNTLKKLQEMELIVPESGELPTAEELEPSDQDVDFVDEKLSPFEKVEEVSETVEEQPDEVKQVTESEPQEFDVPLEIKEEESKESVVSEDLSPSPDMQEDSAQLSEEQKPEGFEELKLEEAPEEKEEESEQDLDSLINDLLKEESVSEQGGEGPKILDEEEMAQWAEEEVKPEPPSPTPDEEEKSEEKPGEMGTPETETDVELKEEVLMEETLEVSTEETLTPEVEETEETAQEVPGVVTETDPQTRKTILVVDDSIVIRKMVEIALENESYNIVSVPTGKEAFSYLDSKDPDLVILDIMLPDVNGLDILKAIKAKTTIPVVMLSAKDTPKETSQAKELGADDFIPKPFRDEELVGKIHELIGQ